MLRIPKREQLKLKDEKVIVAAAINLIEEVYVHLPLKRAMHAIDPVQSLRLLQRELEARSSPMDDRLFHDRMIAIFTSLRDGHTVYLLPKFYASQVAVLPFYLEEFFEGRAKERQYVVSKLDARFKPKNSDFKPGAVVKSWNFVPIDRAVELNAEKHSGSNPAARHSRGLEFMTLRPLIGSLPPDEKEVVIGYKPKSGKEREIRIRWRYKKRDLGDGIQLAMHVAGAAATALGSDLQMEEIRRVKRKMFARRGHWGKTSMGENLRFRSVRTPAGRFGYLRTFSFMPPKRQNTAAFGERFFKEITRILRRFVQKRLQGLILDVRGNGGGLITLAEMLLQLFTEERIVPERFEFICTPTTLKLVGKLAQSKRWASSIRESLETGAPYSQGFPLTTETEANGTGQVFRGPVVLITNALTYSATDMFTAGFQDHNIGPILGTDDNIGAGGANVYEYADLEHVKLPALFPRLPKGASFRVALRRSTRVRSQSGALVEEFGVKPNEVHRMTLNDVLHSNEDLIHHAATLLRQQENGARKNN